MVVGNLVKCLQRMTAVTIEIKKMIAYCPLGTYARGSPGLAKAVM